MTTNTHFLGRSGEYAVASQLLMRGVPVHFPAVDTGVDLIAGATLRIQVKTSRRHSYRSGGYVFTLAGKIPKVRDMSYTLRLRDWSKIDFLVCCGVEESKFWVIPSAVLLKFPEQQSLMLGESHRPEVDHGLMEKLLRNGLSQAQVAREMGVSAMCVCEHVRRGTPTLGKYDGVFSREASAYLNKWEEITGCLELSSQVDDLETPVMITEKEKQ